MTNELAKELYDAEWNRREQFVSAVAIPISIVTGLGGGLVLLANSFALDNSFVTLAFVLLGVSSVCCLALTVYTLVLSYHGYNYQQIPSPAALQAYYHELVMYYGAQGEQTKAESEFAKYLCARYIEAAELNARSNASRSAYLYQSMRRIVLALITAALLLIPWTINALDREQAPYRVQIIPSK